jgi:hypothetical protein
MAVSAVLVLCAKVRVSMSVAHFVATEVFNVSGLPVLVEVLAASRIFTVPPVVAIKAVVNMTPEPLATVIPRSRPEEDAAREPLGPVIAVGRAIIRRVVEITIGTLGWRPNLYRDLRLCFPRWL